MDYDLKEITGEATVIGTPHYISPEQAWGKAVDHRSDIYSLGATLHHLISGTPPLVGDTPLELVSSI